MIELDKKFEEIQTNMKRIINNLTAEITNLKSLLMKRLDNISGIDEHQTAKQTHPPPTVLVLHKTLSENRNTLTNLILEKQNQLATTLIQKQIRLK